MIAFSIKEKFFKPRTTVTNSGNYSYTCQKLGKFMKQVLLK
jgi:hypothetical protein